MEKRILQYAAYLERISKQSYTEEEKEVLCKKILIQIGFFQHERLIHLIVTMTFAILAILSIFMCQMAPSIPMFALVLLFFVLLVPYIRHYFILENTVQKMYCYYDVIRGESFTEGN